MSGIILTITGPSLSGKSTLESMLESAGVVKRAVSTTTRKPRAGEKDGFHYHFISKSEFEEKINNEKMIEHVEFDRNYYGVSKEEVQKLLTQGDSVAMVVEPEGARQIKDFSEKQGWICIRLFVSNPESVLKERFNLRKSDDACADPEVYKQRWESMMTTERRWREEMQDAELIFESFDENSKKMVFEKVKKFIDAKKMGNADKKNNGKLKVKNSG